jgi:hypothetical protein
MYKKARRNKKKNEKEMREGHRYVRYKIQYWIKL